ncbi:MAG: cytochrome c biogenesis protein CcsA [Thermoanaerobaculia bacterium]|nr:cytochrome c biogenesis protein CcsA [Thermoanaerobaculia bacterium]
MRLWIERLASLKLTVVLLLLLGVVLAAGTIVESMHGTAAAQAVYFGPLFLTLEVLFGVNLLAALVERWPRNRWRVGFALTHASMLLILAGSLMTLVFKIEGRLPIWEGEASNLVYLADGDDAPYELPFKVRLDAFEIDNYPGTRRPAMFRSRVVVLGATQEHPAVIEMNRPMSHGGFRFFQSSYQIQGGREMTILQVSRDPGELIVFVGYALLVAGMIVVFFTRLAQQRLADRLAASAPAAGRLAAFALGLLVAGAAAAAVVPDAADAERARAVAVQHDGRVMPLDTQARNAVWEVTRRHGWPGVDPVAMVLGWVIDPDGWQNEPIVRVRQDVAALAGLPAGTAYASYRTLVAQRALLEALAGAEQRQQAEQKPSPLDKHLLEVGERLGTLQSYFRGEMLRVLPVDDPVAAWGAVRPRSAGELVELAARARADAPPHYPAAAAIARELRYNRAQPTRIGWLLLVPAALAAGLTLTRDRFGLTWVARVGVVAGFAAMTWGLALRWQIAGRIPASNMYESMLFLAWGVGLFAVISVVLRNRMLVFNAAAMSALTMLLLDRLPMDPFIHPMPPVLSGTPWLAIHVPIIMVGYATLTLVTFFAHLMIGVEIFAPGRRDLVARWSQLAYWYIHVGSILLIAGILTGSIWAASSWGRYWGWDPKEVWSLVAFLAYMAILHARFDKQIHDFGVAAGSIAAFWTILMTYLGVNFVLAAGLHSYGFGNSSLVRILAVIAAVEIAFVAAGWLAVKRRLARAAAG